MKTYSSMAEILYAHAKEKGKKLFLIDDSGEYSYNDIWNATKNLAQIFKNEHLQVGDRVMVECTQNVEYLVSYFACNLNGYIFVPLERGASENSVRRILKETESKIFVTWRSFDLSVKIIKYSLKNLITANLYEFEFKSGNDTAEILYTTGTTGKSKGIEILNINNIALAENIAYGTEMKEDNIEWIPLPFSHSHSLRCLYANLLRGSTVVISDGVLNIKQIMEWINKYRITSFDLSPTAAKLLIKLTKGKLSEFASQIEYIQIGTAVLDEDTKNRLIELLPNSRLYNFYGSTESGRTSVYNFNCGVNKKNCIGLPTKNAKFIVVDDKGDLIDSSEKNMGLLATYGPMNMKCYWNQKMETDKVLKQGFVYSNDVGYIDSEGYIYVVGRKDDIINYKGIKISPDEIEQIALKSGMIKDCACVKKIEELSGEVPKLFIALEDAKKEKFEENKFMQYLRMNIDKNKMPVAIEIIDGIPRTNNGKIQRAMLVGR